MSETKRQKDKIKKVMHEFKKGELHAGSKKGPKVTTPKQGLAIALSEAKVKTPSKGHGKELARKVGKRIADKTKKSAMYM